jgi:protein gp37
MAQRFPSMREKYSGPVRLIEEEFSVNYGTGNTIFVEHMNDIMAYGVPDDYIAQIIAHCKSYPGNTYVFQSKNPGRFQYFAWPVNSIFGTTIETNRADVDCEISIAPPVYERVAAMKHLPFRKFVTLEPILDFDVDILADWMKRINPEFVNIGADSKRGNLQEPTIEKIMELVAKLKEFGIEVKEKHNLERLKRK